MVHESISDECVLLERGEGDEEWMLVKCNSFEKPTVFGVVYGLQEAPLSLTLDLALSPASYVAEGQIKGTILRIIVC